MPNGTDKARITFRRDLVRGSCAGILETGWQVFVLLLAVRVFQASPEMKASIAAASSYGLLLTPLGLFFITRSRLPAAKACSLCLFTAALVLFLAAFSQTLWWFATMVILGAMLFAQQMPLMVHIYTENYSARTRGSRLSNSLVLTVIVSILFAQAGGLLLDRDLAWYPLVVTLMGAAALISGLAIGGMPSSPLPESKSRNPLSNLSYAWKDKIFGLILFVWMLMGLGNLIVIPLRVEYMANPRFGIDATNTQIALAAAIVPAAARLLTTHIWGYLFDRLNFIVVRTLLNSCFFVAILVFFHSTNIWFLCAAGAIFGVATAGGQIAWSLWVTKVAPHGKEADYMSVHTFTTGIRGAIAPFLGFFLIYQFNPQFCAWISASLIGLSIVILIPMKTKL